MTRFVQRACGAVVFASVLALGDERLCAVGERRRQPVLHQLRVVPREQRSGAPGAEDGRAQTDDARANPRGHDDRLDAQRGRRAERPGQAADRRMGGRPEARHRSGRRGREDAEHVRESSAGARVERAGLERLGRRLPELAVSAGRGRRTVARAGVAPAAEVGVRVSRRHGAVRPDRLRRPAVCDVERRLRLLARRGDRVPALGLPRAVGGPERVHHRPAQPNGSPARHLLRRHPWHRLRALRQHRRGDLEDAHRSASARAHYRHAGAVRRTSVSCRSRRSKSRSRDRPTTPAARSAATCRRSTRPPAVRSGRRTRFRKCRRSSARTRAARTCWRRPAPASGRRRRSTSSGARCTSRPATPSRAHRRPPTR